MACDYVVLPEFGFPTNPKSWLSLTIRFSDISRLDLISTRHLETLMLFFRSACSVRFGSMNVVEISNAFVIDVDPSFGWFTVNN